MDTDPHPDPYTDLDRQSLDADPDPAKRCRSDRFRDPNHSSKCNGDIYCPS